MGSSSSLAKTITSVASIVYFLFILLQIPLFRLPCRCGVCTSPIQVTCSQLIANKILPKHVAKLMVYPGDATFGFLKKTSFPEYFRAVDKCHMTRVKVSLGATINYDIRQLEILVGSYLSVSGAILGLLRHGRMSLFGMLLLLWGLVKEALRKRGSTTSVVKIYPTMILFALLLAFLCVRRDMKRIIRSFRARYKKVRAKIS